MVGRCIVVAGLLALLAAGCGGSEPSATADPGPAAATSAVAPETELAPSTAAETTAPAETAPAGEPVCGDNDPECAATPDGGAGLAATVARVKAIVQGKRVFPATTPAQVLRVAFGPGSTKRAVVVYDVTDADIGRYEASLAVRDDKILTRAVGLRTGATLWAGLEGTDVDGLYACHADADEAPECTDNPLGYAVAAAMFLPLANAKPFAELLDDGGRVEQRSHLGRPVSCLYAKRDRRQLCVTREGIVTVLITPQASAVATGLRLKAGAAEVEPPAAIQHQESKPDW